MVLEAARARVYGERSPAKAKAVVVVSSPLRWESSKSPENGRNSFRGRGGRKLLVAALAGLCLDLAKRPSMRTTIQR